MVERLSYDAWGKRRFPNGQDDPTGSISSQTTRGFTGQEELADVGLVHMNGRVYDPLLGRFGTPDPTTESPFSTQGWNRYSYVGNSPLNFTDPSGYCWAGCFWQAPFKALGGALRRIPILGNILQVAAAAICTAGTFGACAPFAPVIAGLTSAVVTGLASGDLGLALKAGAIAIATAAAFNVAGNLTPSGSLANIAAHAAIGCASSVASGGKCGPGALSAGVSAAASPIVGNIFSDPKHNPGDLIGGTVTQAVIGGASSVAGGGKFGNGAVTAAFGYLFNYAVHDADPGQRAPAGTQVALLPAAVAVAGEELVTAGMALAVGIYDYLNQDFGSYQYVVRAGMAAPENLEGGTKLTQNGYGFSVQTAPGVSIDELARGGRFPNNQISWTTVDTLQKIPGVTVNWPTPGYGDYHGTVNLPNPPPPGIFNVISAQFNRMQNPYPTPR